MNRSTTVAALVLASALALAGCAGEAGETTGDPTAGATATSPVPASSAGPSASGAGAGASAEHDEADVMFAQMMIPHHEQAVTMSETLLAEDDVPEEVRELAEAVVAAQGPEIQRMQQMLRAWGEPTSTASGDMAHGSMGSGSGSGMDGMMSEEDMAALAGAPGAEAARLYLQQMTVHHEGALVMARGEIADGANPQAVELAEDVVAAQEAEIQEMDTLLERLQAPEDGEQ